MMTTTNQYITNSYLDISRIIVNWDKTQIYAAQSIQKHIQVILNFKEDP